MSSSDVRDVLDLPGSGGGARPNKKQKLSAPRPNLKGLAREVHNLGGDNPIAIVPEVTNFKKRRLASRKPAARWDLASFRNSARDDSSLVLRHWRRKAEKGGQSGGTAAASPAPQALGAQQSNGQDQVQSTTQGDGDGESKNEEQPDAKPDEIEDSTFAKFNVQIPIPQYTDDQYKQNLTNDDWTKDETDYLMSLVRDFDLRWPLVWDRYEWSPPATNGEADADGDESKAIVPKTKERTMEDLKARYYEVAAKMMAVQKPVQFMTQPEFALHETMAHFNPQQEKARKDFALNALRRSREEAQEEESLLLEVKRILARGERFNEERRELYNRLDYPHSETDISNFKTSAGLQQLMHNLVTADKSKKRKSLMGPEAAATAAAASPANPTAAAAQAQAQTQEASRREGTAASTAAPTPTSTAKKGQQAQQPPAERPKLTAKEEEIYGVSHHDRLGSGPIFRTEKINKLFSHKSGQQQLRITNVLNELDVPNRLAMPTAATTQQYEQLLVAVNSLLDARKAADKLDAEIKLEEAKKAEREKAQGPSEVEKQPEGEVKSEEAAATADSDSAARDSTDAAEGDVSKPAEGETDGTNEDKDDNQEGDDEDDDDGADGAAAAAEIGEDGDDKPALENTTSNKRSASVLSSVSDKSAKRQKK